MLAIQLIDSELKNMQGALKSIETHIRKPIIAYLIGMAAAAVTQSSSVVNGIFASIRDKDGITEKSTFFVICGSNVGTSVAAFMAINGESAVSILFSSLITVFVIIGIFDRNAKRKQIWNILCAFSLIFVSFRIIGITIPEFANSLNLKYFLEGKKLISFIISLLLTALCQSSSLISIVIVSLSSCGCLSITNALFMIAAANIGTCSTVFLTTIGKSVKSFRVAIFNLFFNITATIFFCVCYILGFINTFIDLNVADATKVALFNTLFNLFGSLIVCPFISRIVKIDVGIGNKIKARTS